MRLNRQTVWKLAIPQDLQRGCSIGNDALFDQRRRRYMTALLEQLAQVSHIHDLIFDAEVGVVEAALSHSPKQRKRATFEEQPDVRARSRAGPLVSAAAGLAQSAAFAAAAPYATRV